MDLVLMDMIARQAKVKVVMLTQTDNSAFTPREAGVLVANLKPMAIISRHPQHPAILLIQGGEWSKDTIAGILGHNRFNHEIVVGLNNPKLPFKPQV